jgi:hypothetical protein
MENSFSRHKREDVDVSQGPPKQRKGDGVGIPGVVNTPLSSTYIKKLDFHLSVRYPIG